MKAVIDTNIFISSFFGGKPRQVIDLWKTGNLILCFSADILDEYMRVLHRMGLEPEEELAELVDLLATSPNVSFVRDPDPVRVVVEDPDYDKFIACALALKAGVIISGDKALLEIIQYRGIPILSPAAFLKRFFPE